MICACQYMTIICDNFGKFLSEQLDKNLSLENPPNQVTSWVTSQDLGPVGTGDWGLGLGLDNTLSCCCCQRYILKSSIWVML